MLLDSHFLSLLPIYYAIIMHACFAHYAIQAGLSSFTLKLRQLYKLWLI
jgi:hypothetical protein